MRHGLVLLWLLGEACTPPPHVARVTGLFGDEGDTPGPGDTPGDPTGPRRARLVFAEAPTYDFGATRVGTSTSHLFLVRNTGNAVATELRLLLGVDSPFGLPGGDSFPGSDGSCSDTLAPQQSCAVAIAFTPSVAEGVNGALNLFFFDGAGTSSATVALLGRGTTGLSVRWVTSGDLFNCAVLSDSTVRCWGCNSEGALGYGDTEHRGDEPGEMGDILLPVDFGAGRTVERIVSGHASSCALLDNHRVKCWGENTSGCLGQGDQEHRGDEPGEMGDALPYVDLGTDPSGDGTACRVSAIAAGTDSYCALLSDQTVRCWGNNNHGALGLGDTAHRGDEPGEMGNNLPRVDVGASRVVEQLVGFEYGFCALLDDDTVKCWGGNPDGELGHGDTEDRGDQPGEMGNDLPVVDLGPGRHARRLVGSTQYYVCALLDDDSLKCWGQNSYGELGQGDTSNRGDQPGEMGVHLAPIALGTGRTVVNALSGVYSICAVLDNGALKCWGNGNYGALGLEDAEHRGDEPGEMGDDLPGVDLGPGVSALFGDGGGRHFCAALDGGKLKCWGQNNYGQLGLGDTVSRGNHPGEMGDALPRVGLGLDP